MRQKISKKQKKERRSKLNGFLILSGILVFVSVVLYGPQLFNRMNQREAIASQNIGNHIPLNRICMIRGDVKDKDTYMIRVAGKAYFGCCQKCLTKLRNNLNNVQYASDPVTGKMVNKADAVIKLNPDNARKVLFFESQETYDRYLKLNLNEVDS
jgi:YHS domain-containing protein